ncbi:hypothetical protein IMSAGC013_00060 [Lachnospiraceae bacterium]|nr:hypothetical protein IMSAGC013_00060 [Lachnospiraceae bacterium]
MKNKKIIIVLSVFALVATALIGTSVSYAANRTRELQRSETIESDASMEQIPEQIVTFENSEVMEGVTEHEFIVQDVSEELFDELDSYSFFDIKPGQYALSSITYEIKEEESWFKYAINWNPMGNYIRVGLINEDKSDMYYVTCISGRAKGVIDLSQIPAGNYYVMVYNETSSNLYLNGAIAYNFIYN